MPSSPDTITGNEPALSRLWSMLNEVEQSRPRPLTAAEDEELELLREQVTILEGELARLTTRVSTLAGVPFQQTGRTFRVHQDHDRNHPEIFKTATCRVCGQVFTYAVYATGMTRRYCEQHAVSSRRDYLRNWQQERRRRLREQATDQPE